MSKPEDHRRPPPRVGPPWYRYPPTEALKILAQDNRVEVASVTAALISQMAFVSCPCSLLSRAALTFILVPTGYHQNSDASVRPFDVIVVDPY
jgi:hypothetical protein